MRNGQPVCWFAVTLLSICVSTQGASADDDTTLRLSLHPASEPVPPLKYRLLPEFRDQIAGNATVWYGKVFAEQQALTNHSEFWRDYDRYMKLPLDELREEEFVAGIVNSRLLYGFLEKAARAQSCDWQLRVRQESYYDILLPEVQQTRSFARLLSLKVRFQIAEGDLDGAIRSLQSGFALAQNVARGETVVNALIGTAIHRVMTDRVMELVQQPGAPNLYWALTSLPNPAIDFRPNLEAELAALSLSFRLFDQVQSDDFDRAHWNDRLRQFWEAAEKNRRNRTSPAEPVELLVMRKYPLAKKRLIDGGFDQARVDAMPVARVVLLQSYLEYERRMQRQYRWVNFPYAEAIERLSDEKKADSGVTETLPLQQLFGADVRSIIKAKAITQLYVELLRTVEAIRLHAALHDGKLPEKLSEVTVVPVPDDPMTGQPFSYQLSGDTATIAPAAMDWNPNHFEITIAAKEDVQ